MRHATPAQNAYMKGHLEDDRRSWFVGVNVAFLALAYVAVGLRIVSRRKVGTRLGPDDWLISVAVLLLSGKVISLMVAVREGMGRHVILVQDRRTFALVSLTAQMFYNVCIPCIKLSILCLYARIFARATAWFTPTLYLTAVFILLLTIPQSFTHIFQCIPVESLWRDFGPGFKVYCINFQAAIVSIGVLHIVTDWFILALPVPVIFSLKLEPRAKWTICSLFFIGGFACVISVVRLCYAKQYESTNPSWDYVPIALISTIECSTGILAACMPTWRPLFMSRRRDMSTYFAPDNKPKAGGNPNQHSGAPHTRGRARWPHAPKSAHFDNGKRSDTALSGDSVEVMLEQHPASTDIELSEANSPHPPGAANHSTSASPFPPDSLRFSAPGVGYEARVGAEQQRVKNEREERGRWRTASPQGRGMSSFGGVANGGRVGARQASAERGAGAAPAHGGIVVTRTVVSTSREGR